MASKIKVDQIEGAAGTTVSLPSGQTLDLSSGTVTLPNNAVDLSSAKVTNALPVAKGGTGVTSLGSAGQVIQVNSGASALEFANASGGKIGAIATGYLKTTVTFSSSSADASMGLSATITPTKAGSSILVSANVTSGGDSGTAAGYHFSLYRNINSGGNSKLTAAHGNAAGSRNTAFLSGAQESGGGTWVTQSSSNTFIDTPTYTLGNGIVYEIKGGGAGSTSRHVNRSARDGDSEDDSRNMSSIILMEILA
jgi:hypothetical protein